PADVNIDMVFTLADEVRASYRATFDALIVGSVLTTLVVGVFLRNWRVTAITAIALPLSIIPTFMVMEVLGYTLNGMTLLSLALAIGNLVDDAICMIENIDQHLAMGKRPRQAAMDAAREIGLAVVATTATVVAVFLPVAFIGGIPGQFFQPFGITFAVCTMFSTLVAVTMTPMLAAYWLKPKDRSSGFDRSGDLDQEAPGPYRRILGWALGHRIVTLLIALVIFIGSLQLVPFIPKGLFGGPENSISLVSVSLPPGSTLRDTTDIVLQADRVLRNSPLVTSVFADVDDVDAADLYVTLVPTNERSLNRSEFEEELRAPLNQIPGARIAFRTQGGGGGSDKDLSLVLRSDNPDSLKAVADQLEREMAGVQGLVDVTSTASLVKPEIAIIPDFKRAADLGVSVRAIARTASLATIGDIRASQAKFNLSDRQIPIEVKLDPRARTDIDTLKNLRVPGRNGQLFPLSSVASLKLVSGPAQINRFNRTRQVTMEANLEGLSLGQAIELVNELPARKNLPPDVSEEPSGDAEIMRDIFSRFIGALFLAILAIYCILVLLYNDFLYPISILTAVPFSFGGVLVALLVTQKELGLFALIGIVLLVGLVTKNAILLVDFALDGQRKGMPQFKSVVAAGVSRFRPILMTSLSTIAGMMPIALELGAGASERSPMAITVIGGFCTSTLL
ncbi:MAG: efflux RND transporter permease subunit, partial [Cyanobacteria bacterium P01_H01_bin.130]